MVLVDGRTIVFKGFLIGCGVTKGKEEKVRRQVWLKKKKDNDHGSNNEDKTHWLYLTSSSLLQRL